MQISLLAPGQARRRLWRAGKLAGMIVFMLAAAGCRDGAGQPAACNPPDLRPGSADCPDENGDGICDRYEAVSGCDPGDAGCVRHPFGFCAFYTIEEMSAAEGLGATYSRPELSWPQIETGNDRYDFSGMDAAYDLLVEHGLEPIISLRAKRGWGSSCDLTLCQDAGACPHEYSSCPPRDLEEPFCSHGHSAAFYDFVTTTLEHAFSGGRPIRFIVVENEVNTRTFWIGTDGDYLKTRTTVYKAVKDFNASNGQQVQVVDNGIASDVWGYAVIADLYCGEPARREEAVDFYNRFFKRTLDAPVTLQTVEIDCDAQPSDPRLGRIVRQVDTLKAMFEVDPSLGVPTFDRMSYHFYAPWDTQEEIIAWLRRQMRLNGYDRPLDCSEGGFDDPEQRYDDDAVAGELVKNHVVALAEDVGKWLWLRTVERPPENGVPDRYRGLYAPAPDWAPLPAAKAYEIMVGKLDGFSVATRLNLGQDVYAYGFDVGDRQVFVLWAAEGQSLSVDLGPLATGELDVTGLDGTVGTAVASSLQLTDAPVFAEPK